MQFLYGDQNFLRVLDEVEFWKGQEAEHTTVIREILPDLDADTVNRLQVFEHDLRQTQTKAVQLIETVIRSKGHVNHQMIQYIMDFVNFALHESEEFVNFLNSLFAQSQVENNLVGKVVIQHIIRESEYFIGIAQTIFYDR